MVAPNPGSKPFAPYKKLGARRRKYGDAYEHGNVVAHDTVPSNLARPKSGKRIINNNHTQQQNQDRSLHTTRKMVDHQQKKDHNVIAHQLTSNQASPRHNQQRSANPARTRNFGSNVLGRAEKHQSPMKAKGLRHITADRGTNMANALAWGC
jgi:hypothetical protein